MEWFELEGTLKITLFLSPAIFYTCVLSFNAATWAPGGFVLLYYAEALFRAGFSRVSQLLLCPKTQTGLIVTGPCWGLSCCSEIT